MSSPPTEKMDIDRLPSPDRKSKSSRNHSTETHRTRRSHRSHSRDRNREKDKYERRREREEPDDRRRSRDRRDRDRSRDRPHRDRDYDRDRDRDRRRDRDSERSRNDRERGHYDREREDYRRRKRDDGADEYVERSKRKREDDGPESAINSVSAAAGYPSALPTDSPNRRGDRDYDRRYGDRPRGRDPRDDYNDPRYRRSTSARVRSPRADVRPTPPPPRRPSPNYEQPSEEPLQEDPGPEDSEARSVFVSQLAARLTARDLGYFFEDKLGEGAVMDSRIVTDRISRRSKGIGYVEFRTVEFVDKAISLSGTVVMGLPIQIQHTEAERNKLHAGDSLNLPPGVSAGHGGMQLYVGSLHFNLTESDIRQVFEPFGELEFVDLHRDPMTGRSKGYAFVQYKRSEDAKMALEQMEGFELAGRTLRVNTVHEKGSIKYTPQDSLDEAGGGNLNAASRQALMQKLARTDQPAARPAPIVKPNIPQSMRSKSVLLKNMFDPEEETERDWDKDLADDVKSECETKYGKVEFIKVERESQGEIYVKFDAIDSAAGAIEGLNGRWFGGRQVSAAFISDAIMQAHQ